MRLVWTRKATADLVLLQAFLEPVNPRAADAVVKALNSGARSLLNFPRLGRSLDQFAPREVRRLVIGDYGMLYEMIGEAIRALGLWHGREDR